VAVLTETQSARLFEEARRLMPGGVSSPVRAMRSVGRDHPLFLARGAGGEVWDADGNRYVDWVQSWGPLIGGHAHPELGGNILTLHIGVDVVPSTSFLHVGGAFAEQANNKALIFDGSKYHFAVNAGMFERTVLYMEFDQSKV